MSKVYVHHRLFLDELGDGIVNQYIEWLRKNKWEAVMVYEEHKAMGEPTRPHLHVSIHTTFSNSQYVKLFRKQFPQVKGQKMQGSHIIENNKLNDNYIFKGYKDNTTDIIVEPDVEYATTLYTPEYITQCHTDFWKIHANIQKNLIPQTITPTIETIIIERPKKKRAPTWMEKMPAKVSEAYPSWEWDSSIDSKARIYRVVMKELGNASKKISTRIIRELCDGIQNALAPEDTENEFWSKVYPDQFHQVANGFFRDF
jgi:hypothetical protein